MNISPMSNNKPIPRDIGQTPPTTEEPKTQQYKDVSVFGQSSGEGTPQDKVGQHKEFDG